MFSGGSSKQVAEILLQIQQLRSDLTSKVGQHHGGHESHHGEHGHDHGHDVHSLSLQKHTIPVFHLIVDCFNLLGVAVIVICTLGILPTLLLNIFPRAFNLSDTSQLRRKMLECRLQLSRGLILGMDLMVASDVVETLCGQVDLVKLVVIVAVRSWLGWERNQEMNHMNHEYKTFQKVASGMSSHLGEITKENLLAKIQSSFDTIDTDHNGHIDSHELKAAFTQVGVEMTPEEAKSVVETTGGLDKLAFTKLLRQMTFVKERTKPEDMDEIESLIKKEMQGSHGSHDH